MTTWRGCAVRARRGLVGGLDEARQHNLFALGELDRQLRRCAFARAGYHGADAVLFVAHAHRTGGRDGLGTRDARGGGLPQQPERRTAGLAQGDDAGIGLPGINIRVVRQARLARALRQIPGQLDAPEPLLGGRSPCGDTRSAAASCP